MGEGRRLTEEEIDRQVEREIAGLRGIIAYLLKDCASDARSRHEAMLEMLGELLNKPSGESISVRIERMITPAVRSATHEAVAMGQMLAHLRAVVYRYRTMEV